MSITKFRKLVKRNVRHSQRLRLGLRFVAKESGVSSATLCRFCNGGMIDLATFIRLVKWLKYLAVISRDPKLSELL